MGNNINRYEEIPHTADIAARIYGEDIDDLFENAAFAMFDLVSEISELEGDEARVAVEAEGPDLEGLLVSFLNELLYQAFERDLLFTELKILSRDANGLRAEATGKKLIGNKEKIKREIKAATYHDLEIKKDGDRYEVTIFFDV